MNCICKVLFMSDSLSSVLVHLVQFVKSSMLRFWKGYCSPVFIQLQPICMGSRFANLPNEKVYGILKISYLSYIVIIHRAMLVLSCKRSSVKASGPLDEIWNWLWLLLSIKLCWFILQRIKGKGLWASWCNLELIVIRLPPPPPLLYHGFFLHAGKACLFTIASWAQA